MGNRSFVMQFHWLSRLLAGSSARNARDRGRTDERPGSEATALAELRRMPDEDPAGLDA